MKSKKVILSTFCAAMLLGGCASQVNTKVTEPDKPLMSIGDTTITCNDEYELIKRVNGPSLMIQGIQLLIYNKEVPVDDEIKKEADEMLKSYDPDSETFLKQIQTYGYKDKEEYLNQVIIPSIQSNKLLEKYFEENAEAIEETYRPVVAAIIETDSEDNAQKAIDAMNDGTSPEEAGKQYAREGANYTGNDTVITTETTKLPTRLLNTLNETSDDGVLSEVFYDDTSTDDKAYYAVKLISRDYNENIDLITQSLSSNQDVISGCMVFYLTKYDFEVHDQYIFDYLKTNNPEYLVTRPDLTE